MQVFYDADANIELIKCEATVWQLSATGRRPRAHAKQSERVPAWSVMRRVAAGQYDLKKAEKPPRRHNLPVDAVRWLMSSRILVPDEMMAPTVYRNEIEPNLFRGKYLAFAHGFRSISRRSCRART
jgi:ketol-acid reductoisomerase